MTALVFSLPGETGGKGKADFARGKYRFISYICSSSSIYYAFVNREHPGSLKNKSQSFSLEWVSRYILFLGKLGGRKNHFLEDARSGATSPDFAQEHLVVIKDEKISPLMQFKKTLRLLCCVLDPFKNKDCRAWSSMRNFWVHSRMTRQKNPVVTKGKVW